jgi:hypothetical protein
VTDDMLHAAISSAMRLLSDKDNPWLVVVFYDNLDQALTDKGNDDLLLVFRRVLELGPCLSLVHIRSEAYVDDLGREITEKIEIGSLGEDALLEVLDRRLEAAPEEVRVALRAEENRRVLRRFAACTGNALTFLRWASGLIRSVKAPFPARLEEDDLRGIALRALPVQSPEIDLAARLARAVDESGRRWVRRADLVRGGLTADEVDDLVRMQVILPRYRFRSDGELFMQPALDLLRPGVSARVRS